jgi:hypothetical protein
MNVMLPTLRDLFRVDDLEGRVTPIASLASLGLEWRGLSERILDVLDVNVVDVLVAGWKKHEEVRVQLRATAMDPARVAMVHLAEHTLTSSHAPSVEVRSHGRVMATLSIPIEIAFEIEAVQLTMRRGEVCEIRPGQVTVRGTVKLEHTVLLERELAPIRLPGTIAMTAEAAGASPARLAASA